MSAFRYWFSCCFGRGSRNDRNHHEDDLDSSHADEPPRIQQRVVRKSLERLLTSEPYMDQPENASGSTSAIVNEQSSSTKHSSLRSEHSGVPKKEYGVDDSDSEDSDIEMSELSDETKRKFHRKSVLWRPKKGKKKQSIPEPLSPDNTGDELHRRSEFRKKLKKMKPDEVERAMAEEAERQRMWEFNRERSKQSRN